MMRLREGEDAGEGDVEVGAGCAPSLRSITCLRKPGKLPGPALPVSTQVVTPLRRAKSSASMPSEVPPQ